MTLHEYSRDRLAALLPLPDRDANKYTRGKLTAVVGSSRYPGAACLVAAASQRMGAGYTEVVTDPAAIDLVRAFRPSLVVRSREGWEPSDPDAGDGSASSPVSRRRKPCAYVVGSGLDARDQGSAPLVHRVLRRAADPVLVDGGGLDALATGEGRRLLEGRFVLGRPTVVTPHAGEAARLAAAFGFPVDDAAELARLISLALGVVAVVKGPDTFISDGERTVLMSDGTPALAKAGTGDVLAGMIGALLAQGIDPVDAAVLGATLHARAGREAAARLTSISVIAEDVIEAIPAAIVGLASAS